MSIVSCKICFLNLENLRQNQKQHPLKIHPNPFTRVRVVSEILINRICGPVCVGFQCDYIIHLIIHAVYFTIFLFSFENKVKSKYTVTIHKFRPCTTILFSHGCATCVKKCFPSIFFMK